MATNKISELAQKSWPEFQNQPEEFRNQLSFTLAMVIFLFPIFIITTGWLVYATDWTTIRENLVIFFFLLALVITMEENQYTLIVTLGRDIRIPLTGSLSNMLLPAGMFILGPSIFWVAWISGFVKASLLFREYSSKALMGPLWLALNPIVQVSGISTLQLLITAAAYEQLGGLYPLNNTGNGELQIAAITILISILLPIIIFFPLLMMTNKIAGNAINFLSIMMMIGTIAGLAIAVEPFAIPFALSFSLMGAGMFAFLCVGALLTQMLAANLSRSNLRSQARAWELSILENLSKQIIQSPVDGSELVNLIAVHIETLFSQARVMVQLFPPENEEDAQERPYFTVTHPQNLEIDETHWQNLQQTNSDYIILPKQNLPGGKRYFGDVFLAKITIPDDEGTPKCVGGIYVHQPRALRSTAERLPTILELAGQIGASLYRAQVHAETLAFHRVTQELAVAGRIQASFLPKEIPLIAGWDIAATIIPARQTSGDFYDFVPLENGRIGFVVADVADKGTGAALYMALSRTLIRTYAMHYPDKPGKALQAANERILNDTESDQFVTVFYGVLDPENGHLIYANAGHNPPLTTGSQSLALTKTGIPLGMFAGMEWESASVHLAPGDTLTMFTDGIPEAQNLQEEEFGDERLLTILKDTHGRESEEMANLLVTAVQEFTDTAPQFDDITLVILKRNTLLKSQS